MAVHLSSTVLKNVGPALIDFVGSRAAFTVATRGLRDPRSRHQHVGLLHHNTTRGSHAHRGQSRRLPDWSQSSSIILARCASHERISWKRHGRGYSSIATDASTRAATSTNESTAEPHEIEQTCTIKVIDYSSKRITHQDVAGTSRDLEAFLSSTPKPSWAACRWIYVNGLDHEVIKSLGQARDLHRLAIEDVLERSAPSKVDWYSNNCFMVLAWQRLVNNAHHHSLTEVFHDERTDVEVQSSLSPIQRGLRQRTKWCSTSHREFGLSSEHVSAFMTSDNTIITIFEGAGDEVLHLILHQLESSRTILRSSNDPSMLIHAVIDAVVDLAVPIERAIAEAFAELESAVLESPDIKQSKELYRLRSALTILMDDISTIGSVVKSLCDHQQAPTLSRPDDSDPTATPQEVLVPISPLAKIYLQDVNDHITMLANATLRGVHSAENLTSLIFNTITARQNGSVQRLTIVSIFFLPLTFLTGYFGMNFESMPSVNENTESFFWLIAAPVMLGTLVLLVPSPRWLRWFRRGGRRRR